MQKIPHLYLGIDAGGTKTHALIADQSGHVWGAGRAGTANWEIVGPEGTYRTLAQATNEALIGTGLRVTDLSAAGYGMAGMDWPSDEARLAPVLQRLGVPGPWVLVNDADAALRAGSHDGCGVAIVAGTGCTTVGRNRQGEHFRTFGRYDKWGDFGSASDIVWLATKAVVHTYLGRSQPTALTGRFLDHYHVRDIRELAEKVSRGQIEEPDGRLAPLVFEVAAEGDSVAQDIIRYIGQELGKNAAAIARRLSLVSEAFDLVMAGGVFRSDSELLVNALVEQVRASAPAAQPVHLHASPAVGSVLLAMQAAGETINSEVHQCMATEAMNRPELVPQS